jgi:hypothetical protein
MRRLNLAVGVLTHGKVSIDMVSRERHLMTYRVSIVADATNKLSLRLPWVKKTQLNSAAAYAAKNNAKKLCLQCIQLPGAKLDTPATRA